MDWWLILSIIVLLIGIPLWIVARKKNPGSKPEQRQVDRSKFEEGRYGNQDYQYAVRKAEADHAEAVKAWEERSKVAQGGRAISRIVLGFGVFLLLMSLWVQVPTNTIGIVTSFGKPVDARPNGFQDKLPWQKVNKDFDASRQYLKFGGKGNDKSPAEDGKEFPCIQVKMEREAKACVNVVIGWQLRAGTEDERIQTVELYKAHKTFDRLTENFMAANARSATTAVYDLVNPLVPEKNPTFAQLSTNLTSEMKELVGSDVTILSAQVTGVDYDDTTDKRIADMQAEFAKTEQAKQQEQTNLAISKANKALQDSGKLTPEVLQDQCIKGAVAVGANPGACLQPGWGAFGTANK